MNKYSGFDSKDFVLDEDFRRWVLKPTPELDNFWYQWLRENPGEVIKIQEAKQVVKALRVKHRPISELEIQNRIRQTAQHLQKTHTPILQLVPWYQESWVRVAVTILIFLGTGLGLYYSSYRHPPLETYQNLVAAAKTPLWEAVNNTSQPRQIRLPDGSRVTLQKDSRISYRPSNTGANREVFLTGEAFFEVAKNPGRPFLVYANELVTKVLGTSFTVRAYEKDKQVQVDVKTGRVAVFAATDATIKEKAFSRELEGVVLTPNQRIVFSREEVRMIKSLVDKPAQVALAPAAAGLVFEETPVPEVFKSLEKYYQVDIVYDEDLLRNCPLTATLTNQSFYEKLSIICKAIEAQYEVIDGQVVIYGKGCDN